MLELTSETRITVGLVLAVALAASGFFYTIANSASKEYVNDKIKEQRIDNNRENDKIYSELKYINSKLDKLIDKKGTSRD